MPPVATHPGGTAAPRRALASPLSAGADATVGALPALAPCGDIWGWCTLGGAGDAGATGRLERVGGQAAWR